MSIEPILSSVEVALGEIQQGRGLDRGFQLKDQDPLDQEGVNLTRQET